MHFVERNGGGVDIIFSFVMDAGGGIPLWLLNKTQPQGLLDCACLRTGLVGGLCMALCTLSLSGV